MLLLKVAECFFAGPPLFGHRVPREFMKDLEDFPPAPPSTGRGNSARKIVHQFKWSETHGDIIVAAPEWFNFFLPSFVMRGDMAPPPQL